MRLDVWLVEHQHFSSRARAQAAIKEGYIQVNGIIQKKASALIAENDEVKSLGEAYSYVSRAALKLKAALNTFHFVVKDQCVLDIGAAHGGFTEVLLEFGAKEVVAIDVGRDQFSSYLAKDPRVHIHEQTHFLNTNQTLYRNATRAVCDVSFISSIPILGHLKDQGFIETIVLIKPQFEQRSGKKKAVIKDGRLRHSILRDYQKRCAQEGLFIHDFMPSPIQGSDGNLEYLAHIKDVPNDFTLPKD